MIDVAPVSPHLAGPLFSLNNGPGQLFCADTSTLIHLDRIDLLETVCRVLAPATIAPVLAEFGREVADLRILPVAMAEAATDDALLAVTCRHQGALLSEDGRLLRRARRRGLWYYNTLMLISGLCYRGVLNDGEAGEKIGHLLTFARYNKTVRMHGRKVFALVREHVRGADLARENS